MATLLIVLSIQRVPGDPRIEVPKVMEADFGPGPMPKADREGIRVVDLRKPEPKMEERVTAEIPAATPAIIVQDEEKDAVSKRIRHQDTEGSNVCTRHHMRKVMTHGGRSWRCRK